MTPPLVRSALRSVALFLVCSFAVPITVAATVMAMFIFAPLPAVLPQARPTVESRISRVYAIDAKGQPMEIGAFREYEQNVPVKKADIPEILKKAVVAAEDRGFYNHGGIDPRGSLRAVWADLRNKNLAQGGSTITQQYVKNAYVGEDRTFVRKIREAVLASQLDRQVDKEEILFKYLSNIYLGEGIYGVGAAAESYFRKAVAELDVSEAAMLAGLIPAPSRYEPRGNPALAESKRRLVLTKMLGEGYITRAQYDEALTRPVWLAGSGAAPGPVTVVHPSQRQNTRYPFFVDFVRRYLEERYGQDKVFRGGLEITVTLDPVLQEQAEASVSEALKGTAAPLEMSLVAVEPPTGYVKALVGGRDFAASQVNLALGGCPGRARDPQLKVEVVPPCLDGKFVEGGGTGRQPGSSFKPFVLAAALARGFLPTKVYPAPRVFRIPDCKVSATNKCTIGNNEGGGGGSATLERATASSINTVFAQLVRDVGCKETAEMARDLGITSAWYSPSFHTCSGTYALGVIDVSPLDMASSFGVFAARGERAEPTPVLEVAETVDGKRRVLEDNTRPALNRVLDELIADATTDILKQVVTSGTGRAAAIGRPAAGKTGTSQNFSNAWFVGYTPTLSTSVWLGYSKDQKTPLRNIRGIDKVYGGTIPAQTWKRFMTQALAGVPVTEFTDAAPIKDLAAALRRDARGGFDPGERRKQSEPDPGGKYLVEPAPPPVEAPVAGVQFAPAPGATPSPGTAGAPVPSTTTTTTTRPLLLPRN
ncbi:MAG TPA: transglycosylase domain-containing protein [Acidimicrobiales bacterium]|nr:transglycosylase domain-containing protein [Acidimicrobiales bacterium]